MGFRDQFFKRKLPTSPKPGEKHVRELREKISKKAKKYGGDPFCEYRIRGVLPEKFEYGMNCLLDRITEEHGEEFAQSVYLELRKDPNACTIDKTTSGEDLPEIPVLFGVGLDSITSAMNTLGENQNKPEMAAYSVGRETLIRLLLENPDGGFTILVSSATTQESKKTWHAARPNVVLASEALFKKAIVFHQQGKYNEAIEYYNRALGEEPLDARVWHNKGAALSEMGRFSEAVECFNEALKIAPKMDGGRSWISKANAREQLGRYEEAVECYDEALKIEKPGK